ncbi:MAG: type II toxin-antitoxin system VapC family toxin [Planctomycetota bacterium]
MSRYCLDTSAYSHFLRGDSRVVEMLDTAEWIGVPSVVLGELWVGFLAGSRLEQNEAELREFLGNPAVEEIPIDRAVARLYAEIFVALRRAGRPLPSNDIWVAAAAVRTGSSVLTYDEHFRDIQRAGSVILPREGRN